MRALETRDQYSRAQELHQFAINSERRSAAFSMKKSGLGRVKTRGSGRVESGKRDPTRPVEPTFELKNYS